MKTLVVLLLLMSSAITQTAEIGFIFADQDVTMFHLGADYKIMDIKGAAKDIPLFGVLGFSKGAEGFVDFTAFEFGAKGTYKLDELDEKLYAKANMMFSILSSEISGLNEGTGIANTVSASETKFTFLIGAGYNITKEINAELSYGLSGLDGLRLTVGYNLERFIK